MPFFRNNANIPLFLSRMRTSHSQPYSDYGNHTCGCVRLHSSRLAAGLCKIGVLLQMYFECLMTALKGRAVLKIGMQYGKRITDARL